MFRSLLLFLAIAFTTQARAAATLTNYPPAGSSEVQVIPNIRYAIGFHLGSLGVAIDSLTLRLWAAVPRGADLSIYSSTSGVPGVVLQQFTAPSFTTTHGVDYTFTTTAFFPLSPNTEYFAVFSVPDGQINWLESKTAFSSAYASNFSSIFSQDAGVTWGPPPFPFVGSIRADGTVVPEPNVMTLTGFGAATFLLRRRRLDAIGDERRWQQRKTSFRYQRPISRKGFLAAGQSFQAITDI